MPPRPRPLCCPQCRVRGDASTAAHSRPAYDAHDRHRRLRYDSAYPQRTAALRRRCCRPPWAAHLHLVFALRLRLGTRSRRLERAGDLGCPPPAPRSPLPAPRSRALVRRRPDQQPAHRAGAVGSAWAHALPPPPAGATGLRYAACSARDGSTSTAETDSAQRCLRDRRSWPPKALAGPRRLRCHSNARARGRRPRRSRAGVAEEA